MIFSIASRASQNGLSLAILAVLVVRIRPMTLPSRDRSGQRVRNQPREIDQLSADPKDPHPKGIGRFAVRFLGKILQLETVAHDKKRATKTRLIADFNWEEIDKAANLGAARIKYTLWAVDAGTPLGTTLRISGLRHEEDFLQSSTFQTSVLRIVSPLESLDRGKFRVTKTGASGQDPGFNVRLPGTNVADDAVDLASRLLERAWGTLTIELSTKLVKYIVRLSDVEEPFELTQALNHPIGGGLHADIRFFPRRAGVFRGVGVDGRKAWTWVRENCGVAVIDHGFRVRPYGFENDDWLHLDLDAAHNKRDWRGTIAERNFPIPEETRGRPGDNPALNIPSNFQLVGAVFVESAPARRKDTEDLIPSMDREGFLQTEGYEKLVDVVRSGIEYLAFVDKQELLRRQQEKAEQAAQAAREDFKAAIVNIRDSPTLSSGDKARLVGHYAGLASKLEEVETYGRDARRKLEVMGLLGVVAGFMTHEAVRILDGLDQCIKSLRPLVKSHPSLEAPLETVLEGYEAFKGHVDYTSMFVSAVHRDQAKPFKAAAQIRLIIDRFGGFARDRGLAIKNEVGADLIVHGIPVPVYSGVLLNLYTNALKSVLATSRKVAPPHVVFRAWNEDAKHIVEVLDRGVGIPPELKQRVFDPLFTTTSNEGNPLGSGMGLGLSLVREVMNHISGNISLVDPPNDFSTCFRVEFAGGE